MYMCYIYISTDKMGVAHCYMENVYITWEGNLCQYTFVICACQNIANVVVYYVNAGIYSAKCIFPARYVTTAEYAC